jgi:hypothetical protein
MSWKREGSTIGKREKEQQSFKINREKRGRSIEEKKKKVLGSVHGYWYLRVC